MSSETTSELPKPTHSTITPAEDADEDLDSYSSDEESDNDEMPRTPPEPLDKSQIPCKLLSHPGGCHRRNCRFSHDMVGMDDEIGRCNICFEEKVKIYGLLSGCSHVFCISCARKWRNTNVGESAKKCPVCRQTAQSITPSATFFPVGDKREEYITVHKSLKSKTLCRYFENSKKRKDRLHCPMLNKCIFAHLVDGQHHVFSPREIKRLKIARRMKRPIDERTQRLVRARQERNRRRQVESLRASERISQRNATTTNQPTTSTRTPARAVERRNPRVVGALMNAESRAAAAELRLASIQSNVNQLRVLLDQFQERAVNAAIFQPQTTTTTTETTTTASGSADTVELSMNMVEIGHRMVRNTRGTHGHGRRVRDTPTTGEPMSLEDMPGIAITPHRVVPRPTTEPRTSTEHVREVQGSPQRTVPRTRMEPIRLVDVPRVTAEPPRMENVESVGVVSQRVVPRTRAEQRRIEENHSVQVIVEQPPPRRSTNISENAGSSSAEAGEAGIDLTMAEIRNRQWEDLRRRLASRVQRSE